MGLECLKDLPRLKEIWSGGTQMTELALRAHGYTDFLQGDIAKKEPMDSPDHDENSP